MNKKQFGQFASDLSVAGAKDAVFIADGDVLVSVKEIKDIIETLCNCLEMEEHIEDFNAYSKVLTRLGNLIKKQ